MLRSFSTTCSQQVFGSVIQLRVLVGHLLCLRYLKVKAWRLKDYSETCRNESALVVVFIRSLQIISIIRAAVFSLRVHSIDWNRNMWDKSVIPLSESAVWLFCRTYLQWMWATYHPTPLCWSRLHTWLNWQWTGRTYASPSRGQWHHGNETRLLMISHRYDASLD